VRTALDRVTAYVDRHWPTLDTPGLSLGLTDRHGWIGGLVRGHANLDAGTAVAPEHRFQIASISKGFTAMAILQQVEAGRIDLDAPVTTYLPWFEVPSRFEAPVTVHHLLSHTSGLAVGMEGAGDAVIELVMLRETEIGWEPGTRFGYSNAGYKALGLILEAVSGRRWWELVRERVMTPIGMGDSDVIITHDVRPRLAVGYTTPFDDRPWVPEHGFAPSTWFESATADGTICATAEELTAYARALLSHGAGVLSPESFARMTARIAEDPDQPGHVFGFGVKWVDGGRILGHSGGMIGFASYLLVDTVAGFGATVLMNSGGGAYRLELARFALACLAAEAAGEPQPDIPEPPAREAPRVAAPSDGAGPVGWEAVAGRYRSWSPWCPVLDVSAREGRLWLSMPNDMLDWGEERELVALPDGRYRIGEEWSPDRARFDTFVDGRAARLWVDGAPFTRAVV
jgi:CubicO group peptidase (beta-lactamase class C family)